MAAGPARWRCRSRRPAPACPTWPRAPCPTATTSRPTRSGRAIGCAGNKMWISAGDHELTENIVHLVLAKIPGPDGKLIPGTRGISLFIVPKWIVNESGELTGERNDVVLAGLNHKLGWRGTTNTLLNFGEGKYTPFGKGGAVGYLVGQPHKGLHCMFHMMNEARIAIGLAATMLGLAGYYASLDYAKNRPQGRPVQQAGAKGAMKDAGQQPVRIIEHADVKRMLLAQKSYCEGALALGLYCAKLVDEQHTGAGHGSRRSAAAARSADADRQELAERVVPGGELACDPGAWRLRLHARLSGRAVLARQPLEHDPRGHPRHPGGRSARAQGGDGRWAWLEAARRAHRGHGCSGRVTARPRRLRKCAGAMRGNASIKPPRPRGRPAMLRQRLPTRCLTCRRPAMSCWPGPGWMWQWLRWRATPTNRSRPRSAGSRPRAISFTTNCRRSKRG